jgi:uncharacterized protein (DUF1697 family)
MTVMVALLRGVNVGGRTSLKMADLRRVAEDLGYEDVSTYIQSGNLLLSTSDPAAQVADDLASAIAASSSVAPAVMVRTRTQLAKVVAGNPFLAQGADPAHLHVTFTDGPAREGLARIDLAAYAPEDAAAAGDTLYLHLPNGIGRSKLASDLAKHKGTVGTTRNWRTTTKLLELAEAIA